MKRFLIIALTIAASSCENPIDYTGAGSASKMILGAIIGPNATGEHTVPVRESIFLFGQSNHPQPVEGAQFTITHNGAEVPQTTKEGKTIYTFPTITTGDRLELTGSSPKHGTVKASDVVPPKAEIKSIKSEWFIDSDGRQSLRLLVTVADPAGERNYYRFRASSLTRVKYTTKYPDMDGPEVKIVEQPLNHEVYTSAEIAFKNGIADPMGAEGLEWSAINDELFNGQEYTFNLYIHLERDPRYSYATYLSYEILSRTATIEVQTLSESLFRYLHSADVQYNEHNFSEPTRIFSNVIGGYGIFGAYNAALATANLDIPHPHSPEI